MKFHPVVVARIYLKESAEKLQAILALLQDTAAIRGVSVFRAIEGYGDSGKVQQHLLDLAFHLPIIVEFFDDRDKVLGILPALKELVGAAHIVFWSGETLI